MVAVPMGPVTGALQVPHMPVSCSSITQVSGLCGMQGALVATTAALMTSWPQLQAGWPGGAPSPSSVDKGEKDSCS